MKSGQSIICVWNSIEDLIFMQDEASPHFAIVVCKCLNVQFPEKWMSRRDSNKWPARSAK